VASFLRSRAAENRDVTRTQIEIAIGRAMAFCAHPVAAWRILPPAKRALVAGAYFAAGYVAALVGLFVL